MNKTINIVHLYPKEMNIYGDTGNTLVLKQRLLWRGLSVRVQGVGIGEKLPANTHLIVGGGGQDSGQDRIAEDFKTKSVTLKQMAQDGVPMLMICGMYQMFGHYFKTQNDIIIPGIGLLDLHTVADSSRLIGNISTNTEWGQFVGYENHSGLTYLGKGCLPIGKTAKGQGNNGKDGTEGAYWNNIFGSYLHGPILAKSPIFADYLLSIALRRADYSQQLSPLDDNLELLSQKVATSRPR